MEWSRTFRRQQVEQVSPQPFFIDFMSYTRMPYTCLYACLHLDESRTEAAAPPTVSRYGATRRRTLRSTHDRKRRPADATSQRAWHKVCACLSTWPCTAGAAGSAADRKTGWNSMHGHISHSCNEFFFRVHRHVHVHVHKHVHTGRGTAVRTVEALTTLTSNTPPTAT